MEMEAKIIIVEDGEGARVTLCGILEDAGYKVIGLERGVDALEIIKKTSFNVVITDIRLPDIDGMEILELAKEIDPEVAVITMTGYASVETAIEAVNQGAYAYFVKPVNPEEIKTAIANALKQQRLSLENKRLVDSLQRTNKLLYEANDELAKATQAKSAFLASMSHELRTQLNVVMGFSELLRDEVPGKINEEQEQFLNDILGSSQHLLNLINEVLDLSKIESGTTPLNLTKFALNEFVTLLTRSLLPILVPRQHNLDIEIEEGLPLVHADKAKVSEVFLNLLSNATKFTPDGGKLKIEVVRDNDWCQVSVIDSGIGISKENQERIFEPFCRLDDALTRETSGTGLGLALVKQIIGGYGGRIWVNSEYGKGSRFTFTLPLAVHG
ncbi:MAG: ATP-binding protein [Dehalococcoidales bacterium]|nr:ATP-binding protein [Dehalococcoidales bacterium]